MSLKSTDYCDLVVLQKLGSVQCALCSQHVSAYRRVTFVLSSSPEAVDFGRCRSIDMLTEDVAFSAMVFSGGYWLTRQHQARKTSLYPSQALDLSSVDACPE